MVKFERCIAPARDFVRLSSDSGRYDLPYLTDSSDNPPYYQGSRGICSSGGRQSG
jgi:hypothetical protein